LKIIKKTRSICPECFNVIDATIYEDGGQVLMRKECLEHGGFDDITGQASRSTPGRRNTLL
jgi:uncharacterized radical SAM superfamily Fe-S cluster-containing enzyme